MLDLEVFNGLNPDAFRDDSSMSRSFFPEEEGLLPILLKLLWYPLVEYYRLSALSDSSFSNPSLRMVSITLLWDLLKVRPKYPLWDSSLLIVSSYSSSFFLAELTWLREFYMRDIFFMLGCYNNLLMKFIHFINHLIN